MLWGDVGLYTELLHANWVKYRGIRYKPGCCIVITIANWLNTEASDTNLAVVL
jgi:hypothetical protein